MPNPVTTDSILLLSAEKDGISIALEHAPESRERDSILTLIARTGMSDGRVALTESQRSYLQTNLPEIMSSDGIKGTKLEGRVGKVMMEDLVRRLAEL